MHFDLIVLDLSMPITDGNEACRQIMLTYTESFNVIQKLPLLVAVSSYIDEEVILQTSKNGFSVAFEAPL